MKIRCGFVSNSSSSSFIVQQADWWKKIRLITDEDIEKLIGYGFVEISTTCPDHIDSFDKLDNNVRQYNKDKLDDKAIRELPNFGYYVVCNEDYVIDFLVSNNIPFSASIHYGHQNAFFEKDSDHVKILPNYGSIAQTYLWREGKFDIENVCFNEDIVDNMEKIPITDFIDQYPISDLEDED